MPDRKAQLVNAPYEYMSDDEADAMRYLFIDMQKIATGKIPLCKIRPFARESLKGATMIKTNATFPRLRLK